jgi:alpha-tubulin suppressor-like RCC1 family protein
VKNYSVFILYLLIFFNIHLSAMAVEPAIFSTPSASFGLRNDGILFQFGGQPFVPVSLDSTITKPIRPEAAILTNVVAVSHQTDRYNSSNEKIMAINSQGEVFTWYTMGDSQPHQIDGLTGVKEIITGYKNHFALTHSGEVFYFGGSGNYPTTQIDSLSNVKTFISLSPNYVFTALTNEGTVFLGHWDQNEYQVQKIDGLSSVKAIAGGTTVADRIHNGYWEYLEGFFALTQNNEVYMWVWDKTNNILTPAIRVNGVSNVATVYPGRPSLALTKTGELYFWAWNVDENLPTLAVQITEVFNVKWVENNAGFLDCLVLTQDGKVYQLSWDSINEIFRFVTLVEGLPPVKEIVLFHDIGYHTMLYLALTSDDQIYFWSHYGIPTQVSGVSKVKSVYQLSGIYMTSETFLALTEDKEVYTWQWDFNRNEVGPATRVEGLTGINEIANETSVVYGDHVLALREDGIICGWGDNSFGQLGVEIPDYVPITAPICGIEDLIVSPLSVKLLDFSAVPITEGVLFNWETAFEETTVSFNLWQAQVNNGPCGDKGALYQEITRLNSQPIKAKGENFQGAVYFHKQFEVVSPYHCYGLEEIDSKGKSFFYVTGLNAERWIQWSD